MAIGSFLASAGRIGEGIETYQTESAKRRLTQQQAELARAELARQEQFRQLQLEAPMAELPDQGLLLGAPMRVAEPEFAPAGRTAAGLLAPMGPAAPAAAAPAPGMKAAPQPTPSGRVIKLGSTVIPWFDPNKPDRLNMGVAGFERLDPNASDFQRVKVEQRNNQKLSNTLESMAVATKAPLAVLRKPFVSQEEKAKLERREQASAWYQTSDAREYFRRNPEVLATAKANPLKFFDGLVKANELAARQRTAPAPRAGIAAPAAPATPTAGVIAKIAGAETGGVANPYQTPNLAGASSAFGKYQFTKDTWVSTYRKLNPKTSLDDNRIWALRSDPAQQERLMVKLTEDNAAALTKAGLPANDATLYLAHFLGAKGAKTLLNADANTPVEQLPGFTAAVKANPTVMRGKTVGQVADWAAKKMGGAAPQMAEGAAPAAGVTTGVAPAPVRIDPSNFYLADQRMISRDMQIAMQNRQELARLAGMYQRAGMGNEFTQARLKLLELDNSLAFLQGMQGIQEMALANDPRRLSAVWSQYAGVPIELQPQTDGTYNVFVNGRVTQRGVSSGTIIDSARSAFDAEYRKSRAESSSTMAIEQFKSQLRISEEAAKAALQTAREAQIELLRGQNARANELIKQMDPNGKITMLPDGSGRSILQVQGQTIMLDPGGNPIEGSEGLVTTPSARSISGLPTRSVGVGVGG